MRLNNQKGFTLIELILVIVILGILAVAALPTFTDISGQAATASMNGVVGAVRSGVGIYYSNRLATGNPGSYPLTLDDAAAGACDDADPCFETIISNGIGDGQWSKAGLVYTYTNRGDGSTTDYTYNPVNGTFND